MAKKFTWAVWPHFALCALEVLHAELAGKISDNKREAERLADDMRHVEAVLKLLQPGYDVRLMAKRLGLKYRPRVAGSRIGTGWCGS